MDIITLVINKLNKSIKELLNLHNIVDFKSDKTREINLEDLILSISDLRLANSSKRAQLIVFSQPDHPIKIAYYDESLARLSINLSSLFQGNTLDQLIKEYYDNHSARLINLFKDALNKFQEPLSEPEVSSEFRQLFSDIQNYMKLSKNHSKEFIASQIENFDQLYFQLKDFEKKKIDAIFSETIRESYNFVKEIRKEFERFINKLLKEFITKIKKLKPSTILQRYLQSSSKDELIISSAYKYYKEKSICFGFGFGNDCTGYYMVDDKANIMIKVYVNHIVDVPISSEPKVEDFSEAIKRIIDNFSYVQNVIFDTIVHELHHSQNLALYNYKQSIPRNIKVLKKIFPVGDKYYDNLDIKYELEEAEILARISGYVAFAQNYFLQHPEVPKNMIQAQNILFSSGQMKKQHDFKIPRIRNKIWREVYKMIQDL